MYGETRAGGKPAAIGATGAKRNGDRHFIRAGRTALLAAFLLLCLFLSLSLAQTLPLLTGKKPSPPAKSGTAPADPLGRGTPQGTIVGFMMAAQRGDYERALKYLDTRKTGRAGRRLVEELLLVLERGFSGKPGVFPLKPEIRSNGNLPDTKERVGTIDTESGSLDVLLELVKRQDEPGIWLFASETLAKIPEFYEELNASSIDRYVPRFMLVTRFLWFPLWQWLYILVVFPLSFVTATLLTRLITPFSFQWYSGSPE